MHVVYKTDYADIMFHILQLWCYQVMLVILIYEIHYGASLHHLYKDEYDVILIHILQYAMLMQHEAVCIALNAVILGHSNT